MQDTIKLDFEPMCAYGQDVVSILGVKVLTLDKIKATTKLYHQQIDVASYRELTEDKYIQLVLYGDKNIPFAILVPFTEQDYAKYSAKGFYKIEYPEEQPFGKALYRRNQ